MLRRKGISGIPRQSDSLEVSLKIDWVFADGRASTTTSARSVMNEEVQPRAGSQPQFSIPDLRAKSLYPMSISSRVSMSSLTKLKFVMEIELIYHHIIEAFWSTSITVTLSYEPCTLLEQLEDRLFTPFRPSSMRTSLA